MSGNSVSHILTPLRWDARSRTKCGPLPPPRHQNEDFPVLCSETKPVWRPSGKIYSFYRGWMHSNGTPIFSKETPEGNTSWIHFMILPLTRLLATCKANQKPISQRPRCRAGCSSKIKTMYKNFNSRSTPIHAAIFKRGRASRVC